MDILKKLNMRLKLMKEMPLVLKSIQQKIKMENIWKTLLMILKTLMNYKGKKLNHFTSLIHIFE